MALDSRSVWLALASAAALFFSHAANTDSGQTADEIDIAPPAGLSPTEARRLRLPAIDAAGQIEVSVERTGNSSKFKFHNKGTTEVDLWTFPLRRAKGGSIFINAGELSNLKPGQTKTRSTLFTLDSQGEPYGEYRIVYCAVEPDKYYRNRAAQEITPEAELVKRAIYDVFQERVKATRPPSANPKSPRPGVAE